MITLGNLFYEWNLLDLEFAEGFTIGVMIFSATSGMFMILLPTVEVRLEKLNSNSRKKSS